MKQVGAAARPLLTYPPTFALEWKDATAENSILQEALLLGLKTP